MSDELPVHLPLPVPEQLLRVPRARQAAGTPAERCWLVSATDSGAGEREGRPQGGMKSDAARAAYWRMQHESAIGALADLIAENTENVEALNKIAGMVAEWAAEVARANADRTRENDTHANGYATGLARYLAPMRAVVSRVPATPDADNASEREPSPVDGGDWPDDRAASTDASGALTKALAEMVDKLPQTAEWAAHIGQVHAAELSAAATRARAEGDAEWVEARDRLADEWQKQWDHPSWRHALARTVPAVDYATAADRLRALAPTPREEGR